MNKFDFWQKWLFTSSIIVIIGGILITFSNFTGVFDLFNRLITPVFWNQFPLDNNISDFQKFVYAVMGSTMAGWGVFITFISLIPFSNKESWAWLCIVVGSLLWFGLDTGFSLFYQVYANVVLNFFLFLLLILPLVFTRKEFFN